MSERFLVHPIRRAAERWREADSLSKMPNMAEWYAAQAEWQSVVTKGAILRLVDVAEVISVEPWGVHAEQLRTMAKAPGLNDVQVTGLLMAADACDRAHHATKDIDIEPVREGRSA